MIYIGILLHCVHSLLSYHPQFWRVCLEPQAKQRALSVCVQNEMRMVEFLSRSSMWNFIDNRNWIGIQISKCRTFQLTSAIEKEKKKKRFQLHMRIEPLSFFFFWYRSEQTITTLSVYTGARSINVDRYRQG